MSERAEILERLRGALVELREDGIDFIPSPPASVPVAIVGAPTSAAAATATTDVGAGAGEALALVRSDLGDCTRCRLHEGRSMIVFGEGNPDADVVFVGEGPGAEEDRTGRPFVGRAGELLDKMIQAVGWAREDVYICNVVKCRPPQNRDPQRDEVEACSPFLLAQIQAIAPRAIVTLGKPAISTLLGRNVAITRERGTWQEWNGTPLMPTFHPAYLLRSYTRANRQAVWDDLKAVRALVDGDG